MAGSVLGIDVGTTGVKAILLDPVGLGIVATAYRDYPSHATADGGHEQDPEDWWRATVTAVRSLADRADLGAVRGIGLSGHMHTLLLLDDQEVPLAPAMTWADRRVGETTRRLAEDPAFPQIAGNTPVDAFTATKLAWFVDRHPEAARSARRLVVAKDYVGHKLTGLWATDHTDAIGTLLWDVHRSEWSPQLFAKVGAPVGLAPEVLAPTQIRGPLQPEPAAELGLPRGIPVAAGAGDVSASALGSGVIDASTICLNAGTAAQVTGVSKLPEPGPGFMFGSAAGHGYLCMASVYAAGLSIRWAESVLIPGRDIDSVEQVPFGAGGLTYLPYMYGSTVPHRNDAARAAFVGLGETHGPVEMAAAIVEGIAFGCADAVAAVARVSGQPERVHLSGGVARSARWRAVLAAVLDYPVFHTPEGGSPLGAALLGAAAAGLLDLGEGITGALKPLPVPVPPQAPAVRDAYQLFAAARERLA
ncbi:MAG: hypothetical protein KIT69_07740 [Propionibacteriaceae bacterium]|nr:hypothetical protein [Propionibacteriaceae bacterium]